MSKLKLSVVCETTAKRIVCSLHNASAAPITVGNLNLANLKFGQNESSDLPVVAWISTHIPNANGRRTLEPNESIQFESDYLREYAFPGPGRYAVWLIYNSLGFKARFAGGYGPHAGLDLLDEFRCKSPETVVTISEDDYEYNQSHLRTLAV
jgi:hypothetical protein